MATAISKRGDELEQRVSVDDLPIEIIVLKEGDQEPILDKNKFWFIVRGVPAKPRQSAN